MTSAAIDISIGISRRLSPLVPTGAGAKASLSRPSFSRGRLLDDKPDPLASQVAKSGGAAAKGRDDGECAPPSVRTVQMSLRFPLADAADVADASGARVGEDLERGSVGPVYARGSDEGFVGSLDHSVGDGSGQDEHRVAGRKQRQGRRHDENSHQILRAGHDGGLSLGLLRLDHTAAEAMEEEILTKGVRQFLGFDGTGPNAPVGAHKSDVDAAKLQGATAENVIKSMRELILFHKSAVSTLARIHLHIIILSGTLIAQRGQYLQQRRPKRYFLAGMARPMMDRAGAIAIGWGRLTGRALRNAVRQRLLPPNKEGAA